MGRQKVAFSSGCVTCAFLKRKPYDTRINMKKVNKKYFSFRISMSLKTLHYQVILPLVWWNAHTWGVYGWSHRRQSKPWWPFSSTPSFVSFQFWWLWALLFLPGHALWAGAPPICPTFVFINCDISFSNIFIHNRHGLILDSDKMPKKLINHFHDITIRA